MDGQGERWWEPGEAVGARLWGPCHLRPPLCSLLDPGEKHVTTNMLALRVFLSNSGENGLGSSDEGWTRNRQIQLKHEPFFLPLLSLGLDVWEVAV